MGGGGEGGGRGDRGGGERRLSLPIHQRTTLRTWAGEDVFCVCVCVCVAERMGAGGVGWVGWVWCGGVVWWWCVCGGGAAAVGAGWGPWCLIGYSDPLIVANLLQARSAFMCNYKFIIATRVRERERE